MRISELNDHLTRFYSHLYNITRKYGRLHQVIRRHSRQPMFGQSRGLRVDTQQLTESHDARPVRVIENQPEQSLLALNASNRMPNRVVSAAQNFPILYSSLPTAFRRNSTWKAIAALPSSVQFNPNQGRFIPFESPIRPRKQAPSAIVPSANSGPIPAKISNASTPTSNSQTIPVATTSPDRQSNNRVSIFSTAMRLMQVASGLPLIPLAMSQASRASPLMTSPAPSSPPTGQMFGSQGQTGHGHTPAGQSASPGLSLSHFSLLSQTVAALPRPIAILNTRQLPIPLLGLNRVVAGRSFPDLARASRLAESHLSLPAPTSQGVYSPNLPADPRQSLSQIISAYADTEASRAKLQLTSRTAPRTVGIPQLPTLQESRREIASHTTANNTTVALAGLPTLGPSEGQLSSTMAVQGEPLPRISDWEVRNSDLGEADDQVSIDELRSKISKILSEELRRYLPGE
jgi:hypothetical protein